MSAFCSGAVVQMFLVVISLLSGRADVPDFSRHCSVAPVVVVCAPAPSDTAGAKPPKPQKPEAPTKITISDEGIKIESDGSKKVIFNVDSETTGKINKQVLENLRDLKNLPESLATLFGDDEDKRFYHVKSSSLVQVGRRIAVGPHELVNGDVVAIGSNISIEGKVMGDVAAILGNVRLASTAIVNGEVVSILGEVDRKDGAIVRGETAVIGSYHHNGLVFPLGPFGTGIFGAGAKVVTFIITILLMLIVLYFISQRMTVAGKTAAGSFLKSFGVGLLVLFAGTVLIAVLAIILAITIVGIPVAVLLVLSYAALFALGYFVSALALGAFVSRKFNLESDSVYIHGIIGLFLLSIIGIIASFMFFNPLFGPIRVTLVAVGALIKFVALVTGVGAFIVSKGGSVPRVRKLPPTDGAADTGR
jgi:hypothetical protein